MTFSTAKRLHHFAAELSHMVGEVKVFRIPNHVLNRRIKVKMLLGQV